MTERLLKDRHAAHLCTQLVTLYRGLVMIGTDPTLLKEAVRKIKAQALEIEAFKAEEAYAKGYNDGFNAAMDTGKIENEEEQK